MSKIAKGGLETVNGHDPYVDALFAMIKDFLFRYNFEIDFDFNAKDKSGFLILYQNMSDDDNKIHLRLDLYKGESSDSDIWYMKISLLPEYLKSLKSTQYRNKTLCFRGPSEFPNFDKHYLMAFEIAGNFLMFEKDKVYINHTSFEKVPINSIQAKIESLVTQQEELAKGINIILEEIQVIKDYLFAKKNFEELTKH